MRSYILADAETFVLEDIPIPQIEKTEVLIRVTLCGTCHSEYYGWKSGCDAGKRYGHEAVGVVAAVGSEVHDFVCGDRVTGVLWEAFSEYVKAPHENLVKIPDGVTDEQAILEPWACLLSGVERMPIHIGDRMGVVGAGFMGLGLMQLAQCKGVSKIIAIDPREEARENALRFGASEVYTPEQIPEEYLLGEWSGDIFSRGIELVAEVTGCAAALETASKLVGVHGVLSIAGYHHTGGCRQIDMDLWNWKAFTVINAHERRFNCEIRDMQALLRMIEAGQLDTAKLLTHAYEFKDIGQAFADMERKPKGYIKGYVRVGEN